MAAKARKIALTLTIVLALAASLGHGESTAQQSSFPDRPIKMIVGFSAGGGTDVIARILAQKLSESLGQTVVVENRTGASGLIAAEAVAKSAPDGYTLMMGSQTTLAVAPTLYRKSMLNPAEDFAGVALAGISPLVLVVHPSVPAHSANDVIAMAKAAPGTINFGSGGLGTTPHMAAELFSSLAGVKMVHVAYRGEAPAINDLLGGQIPLMFPNLSAVSPSPARGGRPLRRSFPQWPRPPLRISRQRPGLRWSRPPGRRAMCYGGSMLKSSTRSPRPMSSSGWLTSA
jgi:tripartite-type tricarboxylate transporter receptor subunit TctC